MNITSSAAVLLIATGLLFSAVSRSAEHPNLIMTKAGIEKIRTELGNVPLFDASVKAIQEQVDAEIAMGIDTPIPRDFSGGYTHERHKQNFFTMKKCGRPFPDIAGRKIRQLC